MDDFDYIFSSVKYPVNVNSDNPISMDELIDSLGSTETIKNPAEFAYKLLNKILDIKLDSDLEVSGCFLTLKNKGVLRFCIGRFSSGVLSEIIKKLVVSRDTRFSPIHPSELKDLQV